MKTLFKMQLTVLFTLITKQQPSDAFAVLWPHSVNDWMHKTKVLDPAHCKIELFINSFFTIFIDLLEKLCCKFPLQKSLEVVRYDSFISIQQH